MLPSRSHLQAWNPESLSPPASGLSDAGHSVYIGVQADAEQAEINRLLVALGDADNGTLAQIRSAAENFGFVLPGPNDPDSLGPSLGLAQPADEVPNPMTLLGLIQQGVVRDNDMAQTVRESKEWVTEDGH